LPEPGFSGDRRGDPVAREVSLDVADFLMDGEIA
jgi:hypothetical protein